ncbi:MAG: 2-oxoacid ferredoxin oxidoreductase [Spirochaetes bacterium]|nr:2-oxoacid ferredoxin oxidoreductase [Spirochaetota bacterium]
MSNVFEPEVDTDIAWCPGCGNFSIHQILLKTLSELKIKQQKLVLVSGIGQAAKTPQYINSNYFNGLHGRALPVATAVKSCNPELTVIAISGDGCVYGEGGNHFIHAIRRNPDITCIVHNNMVYGLTKGQASPTSRKGFISSLQISGVYSEPFNPLAVAISLNASFVARAYSADEKQTIEVLKIAIKHRGFSLVDIFQPCVSFNKLNTYKWYKENTYYLDDSHDPGNKVEAFKKAVENEKYPLGIFYTNTDNLPFEKHLPVYKDSNEPMYKRNVDSDKLAELMKNMKKN